MAPGRDAVASWIEGFEAALRVERAGGETAAHAVAAALELSETALAARAPQMRARREEEDARARQTWHRLRTRRRR
jgi:hypothetical protein